IDAFRVRGEWRRLLRRLHEDFSGNEDRIVRYEDDKVKSVYTMTEALTPLESVHLTEQLLPHSVGVSLINTVKERGDITVQGLVEWRNLAVAKRKVQEGIYIGRPLR
ncbi:hypothetical protein PMAYCL1PPCAC_23494, partial [Pristionchus mayeri]